MTASPARPGLARRNDLGLGLNVAGRRVTCRPSGGLWLEEAQALVVADLHLEKGSAFAARGQLLPPYDTAETLGRLEAEVEALAPRVLVFLGDSFHDGGGESRLGPGATGRLNRLAAGRTLLWVVGNHDAEGPSALAGETVPTAGVGAFTLVHAPAPDAPAGELAGHLHPCARVAGRAASVRRRCFVTDGRRMILPAFGAFAGGLNILHGAFTPLFVGRPLAAVLGENRVHAVGWHSLRGD